MLYFYNDRIGGSPLFIPPFPWSPALSRQCGLIGLNTQLDLILPEGRRYTLIIPINLTLCLVKSLLEKCHAIYSLCIKEDLGGFPKVAKERKKLFYPLKKALSFMVIRLVHLLLQKVLCHQPTFASTTTWDLSCTGNQIRDTSQSWNSCVRISLRNFPMTTINGCKAQNKENKDWQISKYNI